MSTRIDFTQEEIDGELIPEGNVAQAILEAQRSIGELGFATRLRVDSQQLPQETVLFNDGVDQSLQAIQSTLHFPARKKPKFGLYSVNNIMDRLATLVAKTRQRI